MKISIKQRLQPYIIRKKAEETDRKYVNLRNRHYVDLATIRGYAEEVLNSVHNLLDEVVTMEHTLLDREFPSRPEYSLENCTVV